MEMRRVSASCSGDCGDCRLLKTGQVDMIPCVLDQLMQRVRRIEKAMAGEALRISGTDPEDKECGRFDSRAVSSESKKIGTGETYNGAR
jgi:hypothetical protein